MSILYYVKAQRFKADKFFLSDKTEKKNNLQKYFRKLKKIVVNIIII